LQHGRAGRTRVFGTRRQQSGSVAHFAHAALIETGGASVTVDDARAAQLEIDGEFFGIVPMEKVGFDVFAILVMADRAFARMTLEARVGRGGADALRAFGNALAEETATARRPSHGRSRIVCHTGPVAPGRRSLVRGFRIIGWCSCGRRRRLIFPWDWDTFLVGEIDDDLGKDLSGFVVVFLDLALAKGLDFFLGHAVFVSFRILERSEADLSVASDFSLSPHLLSFSGSVRGRVEKNTCTEVQF